MSSFSHRCAGVAPPGGCALIDGNSYRTWERPRGHVAVFCDGTTYFYRTNRRERAAFRAWAAEVFGGMNCNRLTGAWPSYEVHAV